MADEEYRFYNEFERANIVPYELREKLKRIYSACPAPTRPLIGINPNSKYFICSFYLKLGRYYIRINL
jgi:hypothetical protein